MFENTCARIHSYIARIATGGIPGDNDDLFRLGYLRPGSAMLIVNFIETEFGITLEEGDLDVEELRSINEIARLVERKLG